MDLNERCQLLPILTTRKVEWTPLERKGNCLTLPMPLYDGETREWIHKFYELKLLVKDCTEKYRKLDLVNLDNFTRDEILAFFTFCITKERFFDGLIAGHLENGNIEALGNRLNNITKIKNKIFKKTN